MVIVQCPLPTCTFRTSDEDATIVAALLNIHALSHTQAVAPPPPKLDRPRIDIGVEEEVWNSFLKRWETYKAGSGITETTAASHLFQCASEALGDLLLKTDTSIQSRSENDLLAVMKSLSVIPIAKGVLRAELMQLQQSPDEQFRTFAARVRGKAETCGFATKATCVCQQVFTVNYTHEMVRDVLLAGISDLDIRREALSMNDIQQRSINDIISFVEGREMARNATPGHTISALSSFKRHQHPMPQTQPPPNSKGPIVTLDRNKTIPCPRCGSAFQPFKQRNNGSWNKKPHTICLQCWRTSRSNSKSIVVDHAALSSAEHDELEDHEYVVQISAIESESTALSTGEPAMKHKIPLTKKIMSKNELSKAKVSNHPRVAFKLSMIGPKDRASKTVTVMGVADTGAQSNLWGLREFINCGFTTEDLTPVETKIRAANKNAINVIGAFKAILKGKSPTGETISSVSCVYVSDSVDNFYISYDTMVDLLMIDENFPTIGGCASNEVFTNAPNTRSLNSGCPNPSINATISCKCPQREAVPLQPSSLPFAPIPENNDKMKEWLLERYGGSTFNTCPHRPLPCMTGPPIEIHVEESATPRCCHTPAPVPLHWQEKVKSDLLRDEALGVIERVPYGEPVTWCHRMVVTRKHDGSPRRTVDLSPLNKFCKRETFASESPFQLARRVPGDTWKTVADCWNGYHSVPLRESDRHLTTFITPYGRFRYTRAPQGFLSSGDGYNRRLDAILSEFQRKERCIDDTVFHDKDLEMHWWRTIELLTTLGAAGIVLNPDKFQFAQRQVNFAGFLITENRIKPLPKYLEAIRAFPTPTSTTDIRSWFGLVNQVANYAQLRDVMELFRPFLSPKYRFFWSPVLDKAFRESKEAIISAIYRGVEIFDITKPTCLRPDWSTNGIGYFLLQQHCQCVTELPNCCPNGWKISLAGSRFLNGPEQRYAPIEGEALAIAWGLEQTRYFTQGCNDLLVVTDHKPLTKIFGDRTLDEISNTRLFRLKQRTLNWNFTIRHMPGKTNCAADAASRYPAPCHHTDSATLAGDEESLVVASMNRDMDSISSISWNCLVKETAKDETLSYLLHHIERGSEPNPESCKEFSQYIDALYSLNGVILYNDRVVVPRSLRNATLEGLHAAHQGVSSMQLRAQSIVFWPGMTKDIELTRNKCSECNKNAPSQAPLPSTPPNPPSTPFEQIFADFFDFGGHHYLVIGDRLSGWPEIFSTPTGTSQAGARGLVACLRSFFSSFGVPEELSSDGGPEFTASVTKEFLQRWGIKHRQSSAYHPQSNGRAEVAVKSAKRLLRANISPSGSLDSDNFLRALLQLRNTPDPDCRVSPAQIIFGHPLRDAFSFVNRLEKFSNENVSWIWRNAWASKEAALRTRFVKSAEALNEHSKHLPLLTPGKRCFVQNQAGNSPKRWDRTGVIVECKPHDQYVVKIDGSGRLTNRNRRFLRHFEPASMVVQRAPPRDMSSGPPSSPATQEIPPPEYHQPALPADPNNQVPDDLDPPNTDIPTDHQRITFDEDANGNSRVPLALRRLGPHNKQGLLEEQDPPSLCSRRLRSSKKQ